jgi:hypothetical protein
MTLSPETTHPTNEWPRWAAVADIAQVMGDSSVLMLQGDNHDARARSDRVHHLLQAASIMLYF